MNISFLTDATHEAIRRRILTSDVECIMNVKVNAVFFLVVLCIVFIVLFRNELFHYQLRFPGQCTCSTKFNHSVDNNAFSSVSNGMIFRLVNWRCINNVICIHVMMGTKPQVIRSSHKAHSRSAQPNKYEVGLIVVGRTKFRPRQAQKAISTNKCALTDNG